MTDHHTPQTQDYNKLPDVDARRKSRGRKSREEKGVPLAYPRRPKLFALKFGKWLHDSGIAQEIGSTAVALLNAVVTKEDDIHYGRAVMFWNEQLADRCGIRSTHALDAARKRAIDAGLLSYEAGTNRVQGRYFVIWPDSQDAIETGVNQEVRVRQTRSKPDRNRIETGLNQEVRVRQTRSKPERNRSETGTSVPSTLIPNKPNSSSSVTRDPEPPTGGDDDDEGSLAGCTSEPSGWTPEREAEVRDAIRAAGVYLWEESIKHAKSQGSEPDAVMDALFIAMNHRNPQTNELILDAKGFVTWARTSVFPCDNPPTAAELRKRIAEEESRKRAPKVSPDDTRMERRLRREVFEEFKSEGVPYPSDDQIEDRMKALKSGRKSSTAGTTPGQVDPRPRRHVRETTAPQTPGQAFDDHPQRGRAAPTRPQQNQTEKPLGVGDPAPVR